MTLAILTTKGQVTVRKRVDDAFCKLHRSDQKAVTLKELDNAIRKRMKDNYK